MSVEVCKPTDYIIYTKDLSLKTVQLAPAVVPPKPKPTFIATGPGSLCGVACEAAVEAYDFSNGERGLRTTRSIKKGEAVLAVPIEQCWTVERARNCPEMSSLQKLPDEDMMALYLLVQRSKGELGWNAAHIASLPETFDMTVNWSDEELSQLDEDLQNTTRRLAAQLEGDFNTIVVADAEASRDARRRPFLTNFGIDLAAYKWAKGVMWSRCTDLANRKGVKATRFLAPGFDLANHDPWLPASHVIEDGKILLKAAKDYKEGDEFCLNYGAHANQHLLMWYGFVLDKNRYNGPTLKFPVDAGEADHLKSIGAVLEDEPGTARLLVNCTLTFHEPLPPALVFAAALCNGLCRPGQKGLDVAQEVAALDLLTQIVPASPEVPEYAGKTQYRQRCADTLRTIDDRIIAAFHEAVGSRQFELASKVASVAEAAPKAKFVVPGM